LRVWVISADVCKLGYTIEGEDLILLEAGPGTNYNYFGAQGENAAYVSLYSHIARDKADPPSAGVFAPIDYQYAQVFHAGYFSVAAGSTQWQTFNLTDNFQDFSFDFSPRKVEPTEDIDYFGIWPGVKGKQTIMDVEKFQVTVLSGC